MNHKMYKISVDAQQQDNRPSRRRVHWSMAGVHCHQQSAPSQRCTRHN